MELSKSRKTGKITLISESRSEEKFLNKLCILLNERFNSFDEAVSRQIDELADEDGMMDADDITGS